MNAQQYWTLPTHEKNTVIQTIAPLKYYAFDPDMDTFTCSCCGGVGLFPDGNGGIMHEVGCLSSLVRRLGMTVSEAVEHGR